MTKKYRGVATMSIDMFVEFDEVDIPLDMDEHSFAEFLAHTGEWQEEPASGDFKIYEVTALEDDNTPITYH
jgi:hypothetical protein|tara:strand:- start:1012 stop:1224 length:213 start_codon:yes stop_codon:yes gene_type:complete